MEPGLQIIFQPVCREQEQCKEPRRNVDTNNESDEEIESLADTSNADHIK